MYGIIYNNMESKIVECLASFESYKIASNELYSVISRFIDIEPSIRPCTIWKNSEFDENKIKCSSNYGFWIKLNDKNAIIYHKNSVNGWFTTYEIKEIGNFTILDIPGITVTTNKPSPKKKNRDNSQHGRHVSLIDELKLKLKNRNIENKPILIPERPIINTQSDFLMELKNSIRRINQNY